MLIFLSSIQVLRVSEHEYKTMVNGGDLEHNEHIGTGREEHR